jgi:hypothetical protein
MRQREASFQRPTEAAILIASRAWRQPIIPGTEMNRPNVRNSEQIVIPGGKRGPNDSNVS